MIFLPPIYPIRYNQVVMKRALPEKPLHWVVRYGRKKA